MIKFSLFTNLTFEMANFMCLGHSAQFFGQTLFQMILWNYVLDMINI